MGGFAQEDNSPWFETDPPKSEKCLSRGPTVEPASEGWQAHDRQDGRKTSGP